MSKYVFVTGGVTSSLGKGITAASIGRLLKARGLSVSILKLLLNVRHRAGGPRICGTTHPGFAAMELTPTSAQAHRSPLEVLLGARRFVRGFRRFFGEAEFAERVGAAEVDDRLDRQAALALLGQIAV